MGNSSSKPQIPKPKRSDSRKTLGNNWAPWHVKIDDFPDSDFVWPCEYPKCSFCDGDAEYESTLVQLRQERNSQPFRLCSGCWGSSHAGVWLPPQNVYQIDSHDDRGFQWHNKLGWRRIFDISRCHEENLARAKRCSMCRQKLANPPPPFYVGSDRSWLSGEKATAVEVDVQDVSQIRVVGASLGGDSIFIEDPTAIACCRSNSYSNYILAIYEGGYVKMVEIEFFKGDSDVMVKVVGARYKQSETDLVHDGLVGSLEQAWVEGLEVAVATRPDEYGYGVWGLRLRCLGQSDRTKRCCSLCGTVVCALCSGSHRWLLLGDLNSRRMGGHAAGMNVFCSRCEYRLWFFSVNGTRPPERPRSSTVAGCEAAKTGKRRPPRAEVQVQVRPGLLPGWMQCFFRVTGSRGWRVCLHINTIRQMWLSLSQAAEKPEWWLHEGFPPGASASQDHRHPNRILGKQMSCKNAEKIIKEMLVAAQTPDAQNACQKQFSLSLFRYQYLSADQLCRGIGVLRSFFPTPSCWYAAREHMRMATLHNTLKWFNTGEGARERRRQLQYDPKPLGPLHNFNYRNESSPFQDASHKIIHQAKVGVMRLGYDMMFAQLYSCTGYATLQYGVALELQKENESAQSMNTGHIPISSAACLAANSSKLKLMATTEPVHDAMKLLKACGSGDHNRFNSLRDRKARELDRSFLAQNDIVQQGLEEYEGKDMNWRLALLDGVAMAVLEELSASQHLLLGWLHMALAAAETVAHHCSSGCVHDLAKHLRAVFGSNWELMRLLERDTRPFESSHKRAVFCSTFKSGNTTDSMGKESKESLAEASNQVLSSASADIAPSNTTKSDRSSNSNSPESRHSVLLERVSRVLKNVEWWLKNSIKTPLLQYSQVVDVAVFAVKYREQAPVPSNSSTRKQSPRPRPPTLPNQAHPGPSVVPAFIKESGALEQDRFSDNSPLMLALRRKGLVTTRHAIVNAPVSPPRCESLRSRLHRVGVRKLSDLQFLSERDLGPLPQRLWQPQNNTQVEVEHFTSQFQRDKLYKDLMALSTPPNSDLETLSKWLASIHLQEYHGLLTSVEGGLGIRDECFSHDFKWVDLLDLKMIGAPPVVCSKILSSIGNDIDDPKVVELPQDLLESYMRLADGQRDDFEESRAKTDIWLCDSDDGLALSSRQLRLIREEWGVMQVRDILFVEGFVKQLPQDTTRTGTGPWLLYSDRFRAYYEHPLARPPLSLSYVQFKRWQDAVRALRPVLPPVSELRAYSDSLEQWAWRWGVERWLPELRSQKNFADLNALLAFFADRGPGDIICLPMLTPITQYKFALVARTVTSPSRAASAVLPTMPEERTRHDTAPAAAVSETKTEAEGEMRMESKTERDADNPSHEGDAGWALQLLPSVVPHAQQRLRELELLVQRLLDLLKQAESMDSRKKRGDYAKVFEDGSKTRVLLHALSKQVMGEVRPSLEQHARVDHLQTLSDERDAALSRLRGTCGITSSNSQASTSPSFLPANPKLFWRVRLRLVELTNDQARERDAALEWRPCDRRSVELDLWLGSTKLDKLQLESVSISHWVFRSHLCAAQIPVGTVLKVRVLQVKETRQEALSNRYSRITSIQQCARSISLFSSTDPKLESDSGQCPVSEDEASIRRKGSIARPAETVLHVMTLSLAECGETSSSPSPNTAHWRWREGQYLLGPSLAAYSPGEIMTASQHRVHIVSSCDRGGDALVMPQDDPPSQVACFARCRVWLDLPSTFWSCNCDFDFSCNDPVKKQELFRSGDSHSQRTKSLSTLATKNTTSRKMFASYHAQRNARKSFKQVSASNPDDILLEKFEDNKSIDPIGNLPEKMLQELSGNVQVTWCSLCCIPGCCAPGLITVSVGFARRSYCSYHVVLRTQNNDPAKRLEQASEFPPVDCQLKARAVPQCVQVTPVCAAPEPSLGTHSPGQIGPRLRVPNNDSLEPQKLVAFVASCSLYSLGNQLPDRVRMQASLRGFGSALKSHSPFFLIVVQAGSARWTVRRCYTDFIALDAYLRDPEHCRLTPDKLAMLPALARHTELQTPVPFARPNLEGSALIHQCDVAAEQLNTWLSALFVIMPTPWVPVEETELECRLSNVGFEVGKRSVQATVRMFLHAPPTLSPATNPAMEGGYGVVTAPASTHPYHQSLSAGSANALLIGTVCTVASQQTSTVKLRKVPTTSRSNGAFKYPKRVVSNGDRVKIETLFFANGGDFAYIKAMEPRKGKIARGFIQLIHLVPYVSGGKTKQLVRSHSEKHLNQDMIVSFHVLRPLAVELDWFDSVPAVDACRPNAPDEIQYMPLRNLYRRKFKRAPTDREKLLMQAFVRASTADQDAESVQDNVPPFLPLDEVWLQLGRSESKRSATVIAGPAPYGAHGSKYSAYHVAFTATDNVQIACVPASSLSWIRRFEGDSQPDYSPGDAVQVMTTAGRWEDATVDNEVEGMADTESLERCYRTRLVATQSPRITHAYDLRKRRAVNRRHLHTDALQRMVDISFDSSRNSLVEHARANRWDKVRELLERHTDQWVVPATDNPTREQLLSCPISALRVLLPNSNIGMLRPYQVKGMKQFRREQRVNPEAKEDPSHEATDHSTSTESKEEPGASEPRVGDSSESADQQPQDIGAAENASASPASAAPASHPVGEGPATERMFMWDMFDRLWYAPNRGTRKLQVVVSESYLFPDSPQRLVRLVNWIPEGEQFGLIHEMAIQGQSDMAVWLRDHCPGVNWTQASSGGVSAAALALQFGCNHFMERWLREMSQSQLRASPFLFANAVGRGSVASDVAVQQVESELQLQPSAGGSLNPQRACNTRWDHARFIPVGASPRQGMWRIGGPRLSVYRVKHDSMVFEQIKSNCGRVTFRQDCFYVVGHLFRSPATVPNTEVSVDITGTKSWLSRAGQRSSRDELAQGLCCVMIRLQHAEQLHRDHCVQSLEQERVLWTNHITRVRPVQCPWYPLVQSTDWHDSAWDVAISERLQLLLDQRVGDELRGLRKIAPAVQGYGAVLTELCDLDRVIVLFCLRLKLDMATTPDGDESEASARDDKALAHFRTGLALLPLAMQGVDWTSPLQARTGRALLRRAEAILKRDSVCWERVLSMHTILGMLHGRYGGCLQVRQVGVLMLRRFVGCLSPQECKQNFRMRVMPLLHSLRYETNFRVCPRLSAVKTEAPTADAAPGSRPSHADRAPSPSTAAAATGLAGLRVRLGDGLDHLRSASVKFMQQLVGGATVDSAIASSPPKCDIESALNFIEFVPGELACDSSGSGAHASLQCFRPNPDTFASFGDSDSALPVPVVRAPNLFSAEAAGAVALSIGWKRVWNDVGGVAKKNYDVYVPTAPEGFVAIGVVCMFGCVTHSHPAAPVLCLSRALARECGLSAAKKVWESTETYSKYELSLGRLRHGLLWPLRTTDTRDCDTPPPAFTLDHRHWVTFHGEDVEKRLSSLELCLLELAAQYPFTVGLQLFWLLEVEIDRVVDGAHADAAHEGEDDGEVHGEDDKESLPVLLPRVRVLHQMLLDCYGGYNEHTKGINAIPALVFKEQHRLWSKGGLFATLNRIVLEKGKAKVLAAAKKRERETRKGMSKSNLLQLRSGNSFHKLKFVPPREEVGARGRPDMPSGYYDATGNGLPNDFGRYIGADWQVAVATGSLMQKGFHAPAKEHLLTYEQAFAQCRDLCDKAKEVPESFSVVSVAVTTVVAANGCPRRPAAAKVGVFADSRVTPLSSRSLAELGSPNVVLAIFKSGDDLRQDQMILNIFRFMTTIWKKAKLTGDKLPLLTPYEAMPTWNDGGVLQVVPGSKTLGEILKEKGGLSKFLFDKSEKKRKDKMRIFMRSLAGYCVASYILGIGDRHNDNVMINEETGRFFHIDFGYAFGRRTLVPGIGILRQNFPFVYIKEMQTAMQEVSPDMVVEFEHLCVVAFLTIRDHHRELLRSLDMMAASGLTDLNHKTVQYVRASLHLDQSSEETLNHFTGMLRECLVDSWRGKDELIRKLLKNISHDESIIRTKVLQEQLANQRNDIGASVVLPYGLKVGAVLPSRSKVMRSAAMPIMLAFEAPEDYSFFD